MNRLLNWFILAADEELRTYGDVSRMEDVLGLVELLTATENYFLNNLGKTKASDMVHITLTDTLRTAASQAVAEGGDYTNLARTTPSRISNIVEIVSIPFAVTRSQQQIKKHTGENELGRQTTKALKEWGNAAEFDLVRSTFVSGASGATSTEIPKMSGILEAISTWYGEKDKDIPASKAPISILNPNLKNKLASKKHHPTENRNKSS